ncbi:MAG: M23 family metallopeptidase [Micrococcales bacterium]|nr:M23 family metallopeptidase [Micrococcales bacterium]
MTADAAAATSTSSALHGLSLASTAAAAPVLPERDTTDRASRDSLRADLTARAAPAKAAQAAARTTAKAQAAAAAKKAKGVGGGTGDVAGNKAPVGAISGARRWVAPFSGYTLTSGFGLRWGRLHPAQDLAAATGTPVRALSSGRVTFAGWSNRGYGNLVKIQYWDGTVSWYAHNSRLRVREGQHVAPGQTVSYSGSTGQSTGPHLHLEIHPGGKSAVPPKPWLARKGIRL